MDNSCACRVTRLLPEDVTQLRPLETAINLSFWGEDNYRRFLEEFDEYFGCKLSWRLDEDVWDMAGFSLARAICGDLELLKIGVLPPFQHQGLGARLLAATFEEGLQRGCDRCFLEVRKSNQSAIHFYGAHDFQIVGTRLDYYSNPAEDAWVMERHL